MAKTPTPPPAPGAVHESLKEKAIAEMKIYLAITLYLWVVLALFALYKRALLNENGIDYWRQGYAIVKVEKVLPRASAANPPMKVPQMPKI